LKSRLFPKAIPGYRDQAKGAHHQSFVVTQEDFNNSLPDVIEAMDQPSTDGVNSYFICKYAKDYGLKAVLSGLGADELLGGYPSFRLAEKARMASHMPSFLFKAAGLSSNDRFRKIRFLERKDGIGEYLFYRGFYTPGIYRGFWIVI